MTDHPTPVKVAGFEASRCVVPNVVGKTLPKAKAHILKAHCRVGKVTRKRSSARKKGRVLAQSPRARRSLPNGAKIRLTVGKGR
jgi:beta-lactam-binding protein with PASTA domain